MKDVRADAPSLLPAACRGRRARRSGDTAEHAQGDVTCPCFSIQLPQNPPDPNLRRRWVGLGESRGVLRSWRRRFAPLGLRVRPVRADRYRPLHQPPRRSFCSTELGGLRFWTVPDGGGGSGAAFARVDLLIRTLALALVTACRPRQHELCFAGSIRFGCVRTGSELSVLSLFRTAPQRPLCCCCRF